MALEDDPTDLLEVDGLSKENSSSVVEAPSVVDDQEHAVDPASIKLRRLMGLLLVFGIAGVVGVVLILISLFSGASSSLKVGLFAAWGALILGFGTFAWRWPVLHHRYLRYRVDAKGMRIRRGVLWRKIISIPTTRVQHTDVTQGPLQRNFGLSTLTVHTAGTQSASIGLSGLSHEIALRLRDHLLPIDVSSKVPSPENLSPEDLSQEDNSGA